MSAELCRRPGFSQTYAGIPERYSCLSSVVGRYGVAPSAIRRRDFNGSGLSNRFHFLLFELHVTLGQVTVKSSVSGNLLLTQDLEMGDSSIAREAFAE